MEQFDLIPANTMCRCQMAISADNKTLGTPYVTAEFVVIAGPYTGRKIYQDFVLSGDKDAGRSINIGRSYLRAILESARGFNPDDKSPEAVTARRVSSLSDFNGLEFAVKIGIDKGKDNYADKNKITQIITPDHQEYRPTMSPAEGH
ncbi:MAG: hypothetical protein HQK57_16565 [Deltaproteobacteria bacterium]|nr:hypothetical protein [Deltaproteobacteria bacterium]